MESLREWSGYVCFAAVGCSVVQLLLPKEGTGKLLRLLVSTFFLCSLAMPLLEFRTQLSLDVDFLPQEIVSQELDEKVNEQLHRQIETVVCQITEECLAIRDVVPEKITVKTDTSETGGIYIQQVIVYVDKQSLNVAMTVRDVLETQLETDVLIKTA